MKKPISEEYFLCISVSHNSSAALMKNGLIISAALEERFVRIKNYYGYPYNSIEYCLKKSKISGNNLSGVAFTAQTFHGLEVKSKRTIYYDLQDWHDYYGEKYYIPKMKGDKKAVLEYQKYLRDDPKFNIIDDHFDFSYLNDNKYLLDINLDIEKFREVQAETLSNHIGFDKSKVKFLDHQSCHAYYAYFGSPFRDKPCIVLTLDSWGDGRNQTVWKIIDNNFQLISESSENDIGRIYKLTTLLLSMKPNEHEFKVMGLAPYAKENYARKAMKVLENISKIIGMKIVSDKRPKDLYNYLKNNWQTTRFDNIAGAVQLFTEEIVKKLINNIIKETGINRFVFSGGVSMNIKLNKAITEIQKVKEFYVCASGADESTSIGGCYLLNHKSTHPNKPIKNMCLGYDINDEFKKFNYNKLNKNLEIKQNVCMDDVIDMIINGNIIGVIRGKAEFGARALGNRSIIANPSKLDIVQRINEAIKNRDFWMPFALSIQSEYANDYLINPKNIQSPFMTIGYSTNKKIYDQIVAGTHPYDKTVRPQIVDQIYSPEWWSIINKFRIKTKIPALLNTSLNLHGEPIVNTIDDAIRTFELSGLDHLLINDKVFLSKKLNI